MKGWFEIKVRATLGPDKGDDKEVVILGRKVREMATEKKRSTPCEITLLLRLDGMTLMEVS